MEPIEYLKVLQRRWRLLVACVLVTAAAGWLLAPSGANTATADAYAATISLIPTPGDKAEEEPNLNRVAYLVTVGQVPQMAADALERKGDIESLLAAVSASVDIEAGTVTITATGATAAEAGARADAFADATVTYQRVSVENARANAATEAKSQLDKISDRIDRLDEKLRDVPAGSTTSELMEAQKNAEIQRYGVVYSRMQELTSPVTSSVQKVDTPTTTKTSASGIAPPSSLPARLLLFSFVGLALGVVAALVLDRLDTRLRTRTAVEEAFNLPVVAEIPRASRRLMRKGAVVVSSHPGSVVAEGYRSLRSALMLMTIAPAGDGTGHADHGDDEPGRAPQVMLVTSALSRDGKSTTVANLAAAYAEAGRTVLVLDCDFRNPEAPFELSGRPTVGLSELLLADRPTDLPRARHPSGVPGVHVVTSGAVTEHPAVLMLKMGGIIAEARKHADIVLVDSAPMLSTNDTTDLTQHVDAVLVVCRVGRQTPEQASRVSDTLARAAVPIFGIALVGVQGPSPLSLAARTSGSVARWPVHRTGWSDPRLRTSARPSADPPAAETAVRETALRETAVRETAVRETAGEAASGARPVPPPPPPQQWVRPLPQRDRPADRPDAPGWRRDHRTDDDRGGELR
jgi:capsular exopolysaccharide synthesis family protein